MIDHLNSDVEEFFGQVATYLPLEDRQRVSEAFELARREHGDARRLSGELFFTHPLKVASYLAEYYLDASALIAALLHDVAEDTSVSVEEIESRFGKEVGRIVDGLTKFDRVTAKAKLGRELSPEEFKDATLHKLFEVMTEDVRVGIVKIFDRLHNMRTIKAMPLHKQKEKARETLSVYAPLANRLGMWLVKNELQELSIEVLDPLRYQSLKNQLEQCEEQFKNNFESIRSRLLEALTEAGIIVVDIVPASQDFYRVYRKHKANGSKAQPFETPRLVVLFKDKITCYVALGHIHSLWRPVQGEFDDYIAASKENLYRSLHTTVIYEGRPLKVQLRTLEMQIQSQAGVLAQWMDHAGMPLWSRESSQRVKALIKTISDNIDLDKQRMSEGVQTVLEDVFSNQIIAYTPQGDMRELPQGATPVDFAYTIHTEVGDGCRAALVNGKEVPLNHTLQDGDSVTILRHGTQPQRTWLDEDLGYLKTTAAKSAVRRWFRRLPAKKAIQQGKQLLINELKMLGLSDYSHLLVAGWFGYQSSTELYHELGRAELLLTAVATKVLTDQWTQEPAIRSKGRAVESGSGEWFVITNAGDRHLRMCRTCNPRPGNEIIGYIRKDEQVTVHSLACPLIRPDEMRGGRVIKLRWGEEGKEIARLVSMRIDVHDRDGLLSEIADLMREEQVNITMLCSRSANHKATIILGAEMAGPRQMVRILHRIQALVNVIRVECLNYAPQQWTSEAEAFNAQCPFEALRAGQI